MINGDLAFLMLSFFTFSLGKYYKVSRYKDPTNFDCLQGTNLTESGSVSCSVLCDPMDCGQSGFSVHGIFQARNTRVDSSHSLPQGSCCICVHTYTILN